MARGSFELAYVGINFEGGESRGLLKYIHIEPKSCLLLLPNITLFATATIPDLATSFFLLS